MHKAFFPASNERLHHVHGVSTISRQPAGVQARPASTQNTWASPGRTAKALQCATSSRTEGLTTITGCYPYQKDAAA